IGAEDATVAFTTPDGSATLKLGQQYDLTTVSLVQQITKPAAKTETPSANDSINAALKEMQQMMREADAATAAAKQNAAPARSSEKPAEKPAVQQANADDLVAEDSDGLPAPKRRTNTVNTKTPFRRELAIDSPLELAAVLEFYRRELGKLNWKEDEKAAKGAADSASLAFAPTGAPPILTPGRKTDQTTETPTVKYPKEAKKVGLLQNAGQAKVMFGNILPAEATITFDNKPLKVAAGAGTKAPNGPSLDLA